MRGQRSSRVSRVVACVFALLSLAPLAAACSDETIVIGTLPAAEAGASPPGSHRCLTIADCPQDDGSFCSKDSCGDSVGQCERPTTCTDELVPVCGCDGVTYWNDCYRRAAGQEAMTLGECPGACGGEANKPCPDGSICARLLGGGPGPCPPDALGRCWVIPPACPTIASAERYYRCAPSAHPFQCLDTCAAIRSGETVRRAAHCP